MDIVSIAALSIWLNIIQIDVLWQVSEIELDHDSPVYWKTTLIRTITALTFNLCFALAGEDWIRIGIMQAGVYSLSFSIPLSIARKKPKPFLYMGKKSLPERIFKGRPVLYLISKVALFVIGITVIWS